MPTTWPTTPSTAAARAGPGVRRALGVATHDLAIRERRAPQRALPDGARVGGVRHRTSSASPAGAGAAHHHRSGPDRRPDARGPAAHVLQRALWRLVLSADAGVSELRPRGGAVSVRGGAAAREGSGRRRDPRPAVSAAPAVAGGVSAGAVSRPARRGLCDPGDLRFSGCGAPARLRRGDGEERGVAAACGVRHAGGPRAERGRWRDRARLYRHPLRRRHVGPRAPGRDQGRSRSPRRPRAAGQPAVRGDESAADAALHL